MKKIFKFALVAAFVLIALACSSTEDEGLAYSGKTVILHTNDVHGNIEGYAYVAKLKDDFAAFGANVILVDAGDFSQGTTYVSTTKGADAITMLNAAGYDFVTLGNHEFDYGYPQLAENLSSLNAKVLCANILDDNGYSVTDSWAIYRSGDLQIGFFGLATPETQTKANPALIQGLQFPSGRALYDRTQSVVDALRLNGAEVVIGIVHLGVDSESAPNRSVDVYRNTTGIDFLIDAHSHTVMTGTDKGDPIQSTGTAFEFVGVVIIDNATGTIEDHYLQKIYDGEKFLLEPKASVKRVSDEIISRVNEEYNVVFARTLVSLNGERDPGNRTEETNLGSLIADAMRWSILKDEGSLKVDADHAVAITNGGGIRASIAVGDITKNDVNTVLPFGNTLAVVYVTGSELLEALEASTYCTPTALGGFPQVSGIDFSVDTTKAYNANENTYPASTYYGPASIERVIISNINDQPFDPDATYAIITNDFVAAGGDTYYAFAASKDQFDTGIPLDEALIDYIENGLGGIIGYRYAEPFGRIYVYTE